jgi:poly-gamma-glutamate synthesis protein (capsule biosynthesis protein)
MKDRRKAVIVVLIVLVAIFFVTRSRESVVPMPTKPVLEEESKPISILFTGDIMLDRTVRTTIEKNGFEYPFIAVEDIFKETDLAIGNLEGTITSNPSVSTKNYSVLHFTFDQSVGAGLKTIGFSGFSQANNHALDFGQDGFLETETNLSQAGLFSFGSPSNDVNLSKQVTIDGQNVCFIGYMPLYKETTKPIIDEIAKLKPACNFITVFAHWGVEYETSESATQKREAHELIDAGADLIIGAHPHVIEPIEIYKGKAVFYSLGNFIFDQDFSLATRQGLVVRLELGTSTETFHLTGINMRHNVLTLASSTDFRVRTNILTSELPIDLKTSINARNTFVLSR